MVRIRQKNGFSLIELLAVAALIGLLASMSVLHYARMGSQTILVNQTRQVYLAVKYARVAAIEQQKKIVLKFDETLRQFILEPVTEEESAEPTVPQVPLSSQATSSSELPSSRAGTDIVMNQPVQGGIKNTYFRPITLDSKLMIEQFLVDGSDTTQSESIFYPDGTAQSSIIQLGDGIRHATVIITQTGRVKMEMGSAEKIDTGRVDLDSAE